LLTVLCSILLYTFSVHYFVMNVLLYVTAAGRTLTSRLWKKRLVMMVDSLLGQLLLGD